MCSVHQTEDHKTSTMLRTKNLTPHSRIFPTPLTRYEPILIVFDRPHWLKQHVVPNNQTLLRKQAGASTKVLWRQNFKSLDGEGVRELSFPEFNPINWVYPNTVTFQLLRSQPRARPTSELSTVLPNLDRNRRSAADHTQLCEKQSDRENHELTQVSCLQFNHKRKKKKSTQIPKHCTLEATLNY